MNQNHAPRTEPPRMQRVNTDRSPLEVKNDPWTPIVLSLDGGGIRGLSELLIMERIMQKIQELIERNAHYQGLFEYLPSNNGHLEISRDSPDTARDPNELLPCYFFDYMVGTSTGGLIAVMLGRLRMSASESIKAYLCLGNYIFRPRRYIRLYSSKKLREAIIHAVEDNCGCHLHEQRCHGDGELLRQWDYAEENDVNCREHPERQNFTCKVALVAQRKDMTSQVTHLFRSYNHSERFGNDRREFNPHTLGRSTLKIWEACRATSAAPYYFPNMVIGAEEFLDGGAGNNNPSNIAWNEAKWMSNPTSPHDGQVAALVSLGCGEKSRIGLFGKQKTLFYILKAWKYGKSEITNTQRAHDETQNLADTSGSAYFRFSVQPVEGDHGNNGLKGVKISECRKEAHKSWWKLAKDIIPTAKSGSWPSSHGTQDAGQTQWYNSLQRQAATHEREHKKGGFKPNKYRYSTYDTIFNRTHGYCQSRTESEDVARKIEECADLLLRYAKARQVDNPDRWMRFMEHPHPHHRLHLSSKIKDEG